MSKIPGKTETIENAESATYEPYKVTEQVRAVAEQGIEQAKEAFSKLESNAETTQKALESTLEVAKTTRNEVSLKTIAALRANAEAGFAHLEALVAVKSPSEFFELQAAFREQTDRHFRRAGQDPAGGDVESHRRRIHADQGCLRKGLEEPQGRLTAQAIRDRRSPTSSARYDIKTGTFAPVFFHSAGALLHEPHPSAKHRFSKQLATERRAETKARNRDEDAALVLQLLDH